MITMTNCDADGLQPVSDALSFVGLVVALDEIDSSQCPWIPYQ